jgi:predicted PurR-regulated permease PerM
MHAGPERIDETHHGPHAEANSDRPPGSHDGESPAVEAVANVPVNRGTALTILAALAILFALRFAQPILVPIVLALLISYALEPVVSTLIRIRTPRIVAAALAVALLAAGLGFMVYELRPQATAIATRLPEAATRLRQRLEQMKRTSGPSAIEQVQRAASELQRAADATDKAATPARDNVQRVQIEEPPAKISDYVMWGSYNIAAGVGQLVLILFLTFFLLASGDLYRRKFVKIAGPSLSRKKITVRVLEEINQQIEWFLIIQLFTSAVVGVASWAAFRWIGLEQAGLWGFLAGIFNSIPYFGPVIVTSSVAVIAFLQFGAFAPTLTAAALALAITTLEGMLLTPWLTSRAGRLHGVAVFVGPLCWGGQWNVWGVQLAVPMLMVFKTICDHVEDLQPIGELLGE